MEGEQDTEPKAGRRKSSPYPSAYTGQIEDVPPGTLEPLKANGKKYSERYSARGIQEIAENREARRQHKEQARQQQEAAQQTVAQFLHGLPEFSDSSEARIQKVSRELV